MLVEGREGTGGVDTGSEGKRRISLIPTLYIYPRACKRICTLCGRETHKHRRTTYDTGENQKHIDR